MTKEFLKYGEEVQELAEKQLKETDDMIHEYYQKKLDAAEAKIDAMSDDEIGTRSYERFKAKHGDNVPDYDAMLKKVYPEMFDDDEDEN